jgi:hypothetical protein
MGHLRQGSSVKAASREWAPDALAASQMGPAAFSGALGLEFQDLGNEARMTIPIVMRVPPACLLLPIGP